MTLIRDWMDTLSPAHVAAINAVITDHLEVKGPKLERPRVGRVEDSSIPHLKALRPPNVGGDHIRILFTFDPKRVGVMLVGGIKGNSNGSPEKVWKRWYKDAIKTAEARYAEYLKRYEK